MRRNAPKACGTPRAALVSFTVRRCWSEKNAGTSGVGLLTCAMLATGCRLSPPLHPVEVAGFGHVAAAVSGQIGESLQANAQVGVGIAPHLQLEASGALGSGDAGSSYSGSAGLRGQIPLLPTREDGSSALSLQVAGLYGHTFLAGGTGCDHDNWFYPNTCSPSATIDTGSAELGLVGRVGSSRSVSWGAWLSGGIGHARGVVPEGDAGGYVIPYQSGVEQTTISASVEIPFDDTRLVSALLGAAAQGMFASSSSTNPQPSVVSVGSGIVVRF